MKTIILFFTLLVSLSSTFAQNDLLLLFWDDDIIADVKQYYKRVKEDGGNIASANQFHSQLKLIKSNNYLDSLVFWVSSLGGLKKAGDSVQICYDLRGNDVIGEPNAYPLFSIDGISNENVIRFTGNNFLSNSSLEVQQSFTLVLTVKQNEPNDNENILNSSANDDYSISTDKKNELTITAGKKLKAGSLGNNKNIVIIEFNGENSRVFINDELVTKGKLDAKLLRGVLFGKNNKNNPDYYSGDFYNCGIFNTIISDAFRSSLFQKLK